MTWIQPLIDLQILVLEPLVIHYSRDYLGVMVPEMIRLGQEVKVLD